MYEWLKAIIGDDLYAQVLPKLTAAGDKVKLANLADGGYVGKDKFDAAETARKDAVKQLGERDAQITELKKVDPAQLQAKITELEAKNAAAKVEADKRIADMQFDMAASTYASSLKFTSELAKSAFISEFKKAGLKMGDDGKFLGADDFTKGIREKNPTAFEPEKKSMGNLGGYSAAKFGGTGENETNVAMNNLIRSRGVSE